MNLRARFFVAICAVAFTAGTAVSADARDEVRVSFANGRVTIVANNATLVEILREWTRVGGSTFVNAEKVPSAERLTLRLENETETRALDVLLRSAAGYLAGGRKPQMTGPSTIGNVVIMPTTNAAAYAQSTAAPIEIPDAAEVPRAPIARPRPDDDGPTRQQTPPPAPAQALGPGMSASGPPTQSSPGSPMGQANPLQGTTTQTVPGLGAVTSSQPGAVIPNTRPGGRAPNTPTQPVTRPGGGG